MVDLSKERSRVAVSSAETALFVGGGSAAGTALGVLLDPVAGWLAGRTWLPAGGFFDEIDRFAGWAPTWGQAVVGVVVGAAVGLFLVSQATVIEVDRREVVVRKGDTRHRYARGQIGEVVLEGRHVSLRDHRDVELLRESVDGDLAALHDALDRHGWPVRS